MRPPPGPGVEEEVRSGPGVEEQRMCGLAPGPVVELRRECAASAWPRGGAEAGACPWPRGGGAENVPPPPGPGLEEGRMCGLVPGRRRCGLRLAPGWS